MRQRITRLVADQSGAMAVMAALLMIVLLAVAALIIDYGRMVSVQNELQKAAEAGALAGAQALGSSTNPNWSLGQSQAINMVKQNRADGETLTDCQVQYGYWSLLSHKLYATPPQENPSLVPAIQVMVAKGTDQNGVSQNGGPLPLFFAPILGVKTKSVTAGAVAMLNSGANFSVLETGNATVTINSNSGVNRDAGHNGSGSFILNSNSTVQGKIYLNTKTSFTNNGGLAKGGVQQNAGSDAVLAQAVQTAQTAYTNYNLLANNLGTRAIQLNSGQQLTLTGTASVNVVDVTSLLLNANSTLTLSDNSTMSFVVRVSGTFILNSNSYVYLSGGLKPDNVTFVMTGTSGAIINSNCIMNGSILSPASSVTLNSNATLYGAIVSGKNITINSNSVVTPPSTFLSSGGHGASLLN